MVIRFCEGGASSVPRRRMTVLVDFGIELIFEIENVKFEHVYIPKGSDVGM
jgi:hypothetical protein